MKKTAVSFAVLVAFSLASYGQEAFKHLSVGLEASTAGIGLDLNLPVLKDHLVLKAGYTFGDFGTGFKTPGPDESEVNAQIDEVNKNLASVGAPERINTKFSNFDINMAAKLRMSTAKLLLEYYPAKKSSFHITAGLYFGISPLMASVGISGHENFEEEINALVAEVDELNKKYSGDPNYSPVDIQEYSSICFSMGKKSYEINTSNTVFGLGMPQLRPYLGVGFGRSIPRTRFGFQFDLGVWYHKSLTLSGIKEVAYDPSYASIGDFDISTITSIPVYPHLSFRLIYRIF